MNGLKDKFALDEYLPYEPVKAVMDLFEGEDWGGVVDELVKWYYILLSEEGAIAGYVDEGLVKSRAGFVAFYKELVSLVGASNCFYWGAKFRVAKGEWPGPDEMWRFMKGDEEGLGLYLTAEEMGFPVTVMRRFCTQNDMDVVKRLLWKWFKTVEAHEGPYRDNMAEASTYYEEVVCVIIEGACEVVKRVPWEANPGERVRKQ